MCIRDRYFSGIYGDKAFTDKPVFDEYYRVEFQQVAKSCGFNAMAKETIRRLRGQSYRLVLATNPIFPAVATESRIRWAGLEPEDFVLYTTYENTGYCKPNPEYYRDILKKLDGDPDECLMVGNDVEAVSYTHLDVYKRQGWSSRHGRHESRQRHAGRRH